MDRKNKRDFTAVFVTVIIISMIIGVISILKIVSINKEYERAKDVYSEVSDRYVIEINDETVDIPVVEESEDVETPSFIWDYESAHSQYPDIVGYIYQDNTEFLSYPVLQGETNDTYLRHLITGEYNIAGSIFADSGYPYALEGNYCVVYGHNMKNHSMFGSLLCYRDPEYYKGHESFDIYVKDRHYRYMVYAVCTSPVDGDIFTYTFDSEESFIKLFEDLRERSDFTIDDGLGPVTAEDHFICLTTCTYDLNYSYRYTVVIRRGEEYDDSLFTGVKDETDVEEQESQNKEDHIETGVHENPPVSVEERNCHSISNNTAASDGTDLDGRSDEFGDAGRLYIPDIGISVALYWCTLKDSDYSQYITDLEDSAARFKAPGIISDHNNQEFSKLSEVMPGMKGVIIHDDGTSDENLTCIGTGMGYNNGQMLYDHNGTGMYDFTSYLTMYTCTTDWNHVFTCSWELDA